MPWTEATIADINGDLRKDVIAATGVFSFIDVFVAGPLKEQYNPFYLATVDPPTALRVGDYDGDYVADLAVIERGDFTGRDSSLSIMYGRTQGAPEPPISIGSFAPVIALEPTNIVKNAAFQLDTVTDLLVQFEGETEKGVAVLFGNSQRTLLSPYSLIPPEGGAEEQPLAAVTGDLDGDGLPDLFAVSALRGWFLRGTENGDLETVDAPLLAAGGLNQVRCTRWATGRFLGADADVIVGLDQSTVGRFCSPEIIDGIRPPPSLVFARVEAGELVTHSVVLPESFGSAVALEGADLDGDGLDELVIVMQSRDEPVRVLWDTAGEVGADQATVAPPLPGACPGCNASPLSLSVGNLDEDPQPEIAVLADTGVWVLEVDPETRALVWHDTPLLAPLNQPFADGDVRVVDLDGDGVLDVAVSQGTVVVSRRSVPLR